MNTPDGAGAPTIRHSAGEPGGSTPNRPTRHRGDAAAWSDWMTRAPAHHQRTLMLAVAVIAAVHLAIALKADLANDARMQWAQIAAGRLNDWHPPAMARLWQALGVFGPGAPPFIMFSVLLYWSGLLVLGAVFVRTRKPGAAVVTVAIGVLASIATAEPGKPASTIKMA